MVTMGTCSTTAIAEVIAATTVASELKTVQAVSTVPTTVTAEVEKKVQAVILDEEDYRSMIVPLGQVVDQNYSRIMNTLPVDGDGTVVALRAILTMWNCIWHTPNDGWRRVRAKIKLAMVKETKTCGNTSVSMGAAKLYFDKNQDKTSVGFVNSGSGGNKYQLYARLENGNISVEYEYKPKKGSSPQRASAGGYIPALGDALEDSENMRMLANEIVAFRVGAEKLGRPCGEILAFVTGKFRNHWEIQEPEFKKKMDTKMDEHFGSVANESIRPAFGSTFVLAQNDEGDLEAIGTTDMYKNLIKSRFINSGFGVIGVCGIGQGSVQIKCQSQDEKDCGRVNYSPGMSKPAGLADLPWTAVPLIRLFMDNIVKWADECEEPAIALKSGCMLFVGFPEGRKTLDAMLYVEKPVEPIEPPKNPPAELIKILTGFLSSTSTVLEQINKYCFPAPEQPVQANPKTIIVAQPVTAAAVHDVVDVNQPVTIHSSANHA